MAKTQKKSGPPVNLTDEEKTVRILITSARPRHPPSASAHQRNRANTAREPLPPPLRYRQRPCAPKDTFAPAV